MEAFWIRHLPGLKKMQELIQGGAIGDVVCARSEFGFVSKGARKDRKLNSALAGGALLDIGIYNFGFMRMLMNDEQPESFESYYHINEYGTDDFSTILLRYPNGKSASVTAAIGTDMKRHAMIYGTAGSIFFEDYQFAEKMTVQPSGQEAYTLEFPHEVNGFEYEIREVERCVKLGMTTRDVLKKEDTLEVLKLIDDIRASWGLVFDCERA